MNFKSIDDLAELVTAQYTALDDRISNGSLFTAPPPEAIRDLLKICFFASLKREETRPTEFDLALCSPKELTEIAFRFSRYTRVFNLKSFDAARLLTVGELVRLAPACNPDKTLLLAHWDSQQGGLSLWGVADIGWESKGEDARLTSLRIRVFSPGEMKITVQGSTLCSFKDGIISTPEIGLINKGVIYDFFKPTSLDLAREVNLVTKQVDPALPIVERDSRAMDYLWVIQQLSERLQRLGHGGCLLILPEEYSENIWSHLNVKYRCRESTIWEQLIGKWILHFQRYEPGAATVSAEDILSIEYQLQDVETGVRDSLESITRLSAVDGAVLITRRFELLGFGCVVRLRERPEYEVFRCSDRAGTVREATALDSYGTRHRSAFEFCYRCAPSVAIVVSSDGGTKCVTRRGDEIHFWENTPFDVFSERVRNREHFATRTP